MDQFRYFLALLLTPLIVTAEPIVSEFMASNSTTLTDEDGEYGDWIEIHNPDVTAVNMSGWFLTDDILTLNKWTFPAETIPAGGRLVVFADSKNRAVAGSELHTNFKLSAGGEFLALVKPDGVTKTSEFNEFPAQITDFSYGLHQATTVLTEVVGTTSGLSYHIPSTNISGWNTASFDDSSWSTGSGGIGYERSTGNEYDSYISTDIESVMYNQRSTVYLRYEFNVADASAVEAMELFAKYDDGFVAYLNGELLTSENAPGSVAWNSIAVAHREAALNSFDTWALDSEVEHLVDGNNVLAIHLLNRFASSSDFLMQTKLELGVNVPVVATEYSYFESPTPGTVNNSDPLQPSGGVAISVPSGVKSSPISVELTTAEPTASIYYTLDGSVPDETSSLYSGALTISNPAQLRARAYEVNKTGGETAVADYSFLDPSLLGYLSDVPVIVMDNFGQGAYPSKGHSNDGNNIVQVERQSNVMSFYGVAGNSQPFSAVPSLESRSGCRVRGASSNGFPRKSLSVELWDDSEDDADDNSAMPFGMSSEADWVLYAPNPSIDRSLVHNPVSFEFGKLIGALAPDSKVVVVFQNTDGGKVGVGDLAGVYVLMEKIERSRAGVNFDKMSVDGTSGGWMINVDRLNAIPVGQPSTTVQPNFHAAGPNGILEIGDDADGDNSPQGEDDISTFYHSFLNFEEPNGYDILAAQRNQVQTQIRAMDAVLWSANSGNETTGFPSVIDVSSWVEFYLAQNFAANLDAIVLSTRIFKRDSSSKIEMGPIWDFDRAYTSRGAATNNTFWASDRDWYAALFQDINFLQAHQDAWQEARRTVIDDSVLRGLVDTAVAGLRADQIAASGLGYSTWQNRVSDMKDWMVDRAQHLDNQYESLPTHSPTTREFASSVTMTMAPTAGGVVYYTTDGSDPRAWGGGIAASAQQYTGAITFTERTRVTLRTRDGARWSGKIVQDYYQVAELPELVVSEIDYNPVGASASEAASGYDDSNDFEYIEILNVGSNTVDLTTLALAEGVAFEFSEGAVTSLFPGNRVLVVSNLPAFIARHGMLPEVVGAYSGHLKNSSEQLVLKDKHLDIDFQNFIYDDDIPWPTAADGGGYPLILKNPYSKPDHNIGTNWRSSAYLHGNPGATDARANFVGNPLVDSDGDGFSAVLEHFLGTSDLDSTERGEPGVVTPLILEEDGLLYPRFSIDYLIGADDVTASAEWSATLDAWDDSSASILLISDLPNGDGTATKVWRSTQPYSAVRQFFRMKVE